MPSKTVKNRYEIRPFLQKLHICIREHRVQNVFSSIFKGLNKIHFSSDTRNITQCVWQAQKTNTPFRVSHRFYIKNDIRTTIPCVTFFEKKTKQMQQPYKDSHQNTNILMKMNQITKQTLSCSILPVPA